MSVTSGMRRASLLQGKKPGLAMEAA